MRRSHRDLDPVRRPQGESTAAGTVCSGTSVRRPGCGLVRKSRRSFFGSVQHCRVCTLFASAHRAYTFNPTSQMSLVEGGHLEHFLCCSVKKFFQKFRVAQISNAQCSLLLGWAAIWAEPIWVGQQLCFHLFGFRCWRSHARGVCDRSAEGTKFAPEIFRCGVTGESQSPWTSPVVVMCKSSVNRCTDCVPTFHLDTDAPLHEVSTVPFVVPFFAARRQVRVNLIPPIQL